MNIVKSEEYKGYRIDVWELHIPIPSNEGQRIETRLFVFVDNENVTDQLAITGAGLDHLMRDIQVFLDKRSDQDQ